MSCARRIELAVLLAGLIAAGPAAEAGVRAPLAGSGDFSFTLDLPVRPAAAGGRLQASLQVYHPQIHFLSLGKGERRAACLRFDLKLARQGEVAVDTSVVFVLEATDAAAALDPQRFGLLDLDLTVPPGRWAVTARLIDLQGRRDSPFGFLRKALGDGDEALANPLALRAFGREDVDFTVASPPGSAAAEAVGVLEVPYWQETGPRMGDPEFLTLASGPHLPNPERLYGVVHDTLAVYVELEGLPADRPSVVGVEVVDLYNGEVAPDSFAVGPSASGSAAIYRFPVGTLPGGTYVLRLAPRWPGGWLRESEFSVSWRMDRLGQEARDLTLEGKLLFDGDELERFLRLSRPMQSQHLEEFWKENDPTPGTARNELYEKFMRRLAYAERHFGEMQLTGALTDRGRTWIRFGPPVEVSVEVVPLNKDELEDAIVKVHNIYQVDRLGHLAKSDIPLDLELAERHESLRDLQRNLNAAGREGAFELWRYQLNGDPLRPQDEVSADAMDMRFVFVDRLGTGEFRLEFTNLKQSR